MASGIKKINETVIEDDRSLIIIQKSGTFSIDNKAIPNGAIKVTLGLDPYISVKADTDKFVGINASLSLIEKSITSNLLEDGIITQEKLADENHKKSAVELRFGEMKELFNLNEKELNLIVAVFLAESRFTEYGDFAINRYRSCEKITDHRI